MANTDQDILKWVSKADARKEFGKLNDAEAKGFFHDILESMCQMTVQGEIKKFRKCAKFLQEVNTSTKKDRIMTFYDGKHPFHNTNILLLASEYQHQEIFELILSNYCHVLNFSSAKLISPTDEDDMGRNAYYYLMRLNKMDMLKMLIEEWPFQIDKHEIDIALSKAYFLLIMQRVYLTTDIRYYIEYELNMLRLDQCIFGCMKTEPNSLDEIKARLDLLTKTIRNLCSSYEENNRIVNDEVLRTLMFIALNISVLKRWLSVTYKLPWEETEFSIVTYIKHFQTEEVSGVYYRAHVNRRNIFKYIEEFGMKLQAIVSGLTEDHIRKDSKIRVDLTSGNVVFTELIGTFRKIRNFHSLRRMIYYLDSVLSAENSEKSRDQNHIFAVERCLQVVGELVNDTPDSPNLSTDLTDVISACFSNQTLKMIKNIRHSLSHTRGFRYRIGGTGPVTRFNYENFMKVKDDLKEIRSLISNILLRDQSELFEEKYIEMTTMKDLDDYEHFKEVYNTGNVNFLGTHTEKTTNEMNILEGLVKNSCKAGLSDETNTEVITCGVMEMFKAFSSKIPSSKKKSVNPLFWELDWIFRKKKDIVYLNTGKGYHFLKIACSSLARAETCITDNGKILSIQQLRNTLEIHGFVEITEKSERLTSFEEGTVSLIFDRILYICGQEKNILELEKYAHKICFLLHIKRQELKSLSDLQFHLEPDKKSRPLDDETLATVLDSKLNNLKLIFENYRIENTSESLNSFITRFCDNQIFLAIEMLLLDVLTIYESYLDSNIGIYDFYFPCLIGRELRNYLAHGSRIVDILDLNPKLCILMNCIMFENRKPSLEPSKAKLRNQPSIDDITVRFERNLDLIHSTSNFFKGSFRTVWIMICLFLFRRKRENFIFS